MLARTLIQHRHPWVVSTARAACSRRSWSARRRAARCASAERRSLGGARHLGLPPAGGGPAEWRAVVPPPARPEGVPASGSRRPPAGHARLRGSRLGVWICAIVLPGSDRGRLLSGPRLAPGGLGLLIRG